MNFSAIIFCVDLSATNNSGNSFHHLVMPMKSVLHRICRHVVCVAACAVVVQWFSQCAMAVEPQFNRDIRPILAGHCFACHGADAESREAELRLDVRDAAIENGALIPGDVKGSELISRIMTGDHDLLMPPAETKKPLSNAQKEILKAWVASGAEYESHWSFTKPQRPEPPRVLDKSWPKNAIDRFVLAKLEGAGLKPAIEADANSLFRRLHLDITGLPPSPKQLTQFVNDYGDGGLDRERVLSNWIDRLMESSAWGEHRARYWLDAARYADTHGMHFDNYREMWPYRDWVIRAFNANQPFDEFTIDQLAGDLRAEPTADQLVATGFQRCNTTTNEGGTIDEENLAIYAADRVQTFGWVYLGLTTNCCQCHDHKFDPLTAKDYYSLAAYFRNTTQRAKDGNRKDGLGPFIKVMTDASKSRLGDIKTELAEAKIGRDLRREESKTDFDQWLATADSADNAVATPGYAQSLTFSMPLNESTGKILHASGSTELKVSVDRDLDWSLEGVIGSATKLTAKQPITVGDVGDFQRDESFSFGAWVRVEDPKRTSAVFARMNSEKAHRGWDLYLQNGEYAVHLIDVWPGNALKVVTKTKAVKGQQWQHVFATYNGAGKAAGVRIYVDGEVQQTRVEKETLAKDASFHTDTAFRLGNRSSGTGFEGSLQDLRFYSDALSAERVAAVAKNATIGELLKIDPSERTESQVSSLMTHYLRTSDVDYIAAVDRIAKLEAERIQIDSRAPITHVQKENPNSTAMANILMRGAYDKPGDKVVAAPPAALHAAPVGAPANRMGLAQWVTDASNPLTARVTVNRFWQEVFGQGIVITTEDFGVMGAVPSHPELLDWLATGFQTQGWNVKRLFKQMLMSATYRQAAINTDQKNRLDRDNALLSRGPRFRMDAEMIRDSALVASGLLKRKMYGPGTRPYQPGNVWEIVGLPGGDTRNYKQDKGDGLYRRTLYNFWKRMAPPPSLETFNAPSREVCTVRRERTNTPLQALVTLNDPQYVEAARVVARKAIQHSAEFEQRLSFVTRRLLSRTFTTKEVAIIAASRVELAQYYIAHPDDAAKLISVGESKPVPDVDSIELATWTMLCNQLLNLDETLTK